MLSTSMTWWTFTWRIRMMTEDLNRDYEEHSPMNPLYPSAEASIYIL
jgi:hypothetical protein